MSSFATAWALTLKWEGGYQENPNDVGNYWNNILMGTKYGITPGYLYATTGITPTKSIMMLLTSFEASGIVQSRVWDAYGLAAIPSQEIANQVFDFLFHFSYHTSSNLIQRAIIESGGTLPLYGVDNQFGSETLEAIIRLINEGKAQQLNDNLIAYRVNYYEERVNTHPDQYVFLNGWLNRANDYVVDIAKSKTVRSSLFLLALGGAAIWYMNSK